MFFRGGGDCVFCLFQSEFFFVGDKISDVCFKDGITKSIEANCSHKFDQDVAINCVREKEKPRYKLSYRLFKEHYGYDSLLYISPFPTLIQLEEFICGIQHCVTVLVS